MLKTHSGPRTSVVATSAAAVAARTRVVRVGAAAAASASAVALEYHAAPGERRAAFLYPGSAAGRHCRSARRSARAGVSVDRPAALSSLASLSLRSRGARARAPRRFVARASVVTVTLRVLGAGRARPLLSSLALA